MFLRLCLEAAECLYGPEGCGGCHPGVPCLPRSWRGKDFASDEVSGKWGYMAQTRRVW